MIGSFFLSIHPIQPSEGCDLLPLTEQRNKRIEKEKECLSELMGTGDRHVLQI